MRMATSTQAHSPMVSPDRRTAGSGRGSFVLGLTLLGAMTLLRRGPRSEIQTGGNGGETASGHPPKERTETNLQKPDAEAAERGHEAETPSEIPAVGWGDILWRVYDEMQKDRVMLIAAGVTYYGLLALFPAVAALVSLYGLFANPAGITEQLSTLQGVIPDGAIQVVGDQINRIQSQGGGKLGLFFVIGLLVSLWSANAGVKSLFDALNAVYEEPERRSFVQYNAQALMFTLGAILFLILAISGIVVLPAVFAFVGLESMAGWIISLLRWPLLIVVTLFALAVLYRFGPSRERAEWRWVTWGSAIAAIAWVAVSMLFSWYVSNFGTFNETYGSLGAVIGFMIWMWLSATIVLVGAEINAQLEHQTRKDTTTGEPRPMGERGAHFADRVAGN